MISLGFLASNNGSSLRAIVAAIEAGTLAARACLVVSNNRASAALAFAREHRIAALCIPTVADPAAADLALAEALAGAGVEWVVLSGYLRKLGPRTLGAFPGRILNIHPSLLPRHGGPGMYGRRVHQAVLAGGDTRTGASVHLVDDLYDHGPVIARAELPVGPNDTAETLERRVTTAEPVLFVETLKRIAAGDPIFPDISDNTS